MNKKILIGSIIAVAILIGVSFTSVVGYQSVEYDVKASPLFNIRTSRAIDEESNGLSCEYVGKGDDFNLFIPNRNDRQDKIRQIIEIIQEMDDKSLNRFVNYVINRIHKNDEFKNVKNDDIIIALNDLRNNQDLIKLNTNIIGNFTLDDSFLVGLTLFGFTLIITFIIGYILFVVFLILATMAIGRGPGPTFKHCNPSAYC